MGRITKKRRKTMPGSSVAMLPAGTKRDLFRTRRIPNSLAREIHLERLADDAHIRALERKAKAK